MEVFNMFTYMEIGLILLCLFLLNHIRRNDKMGDTMDRLEKLDVRNTVALNMYMSAIEKWFSHNKEKTGKLFPDDTPQEVIDAIYKASKIARGDEI